MSDESSLPQWAHVFIAGLVGLVTGAGFFVKLIFTMSSRLQKLEQQDFGSIIRDELAKERHDVLYPMLQTRVFDAMDKMEDELKRQGQNIAVLLERDRTSSALEKIAESINQATQQRLSGRS